MASAEIEPFLDKYANRSQYKVPRYQRGYEWEREQWEALWNDIDQTDQSVGNHFIGNIILLEKKGKNKNTYEIVDGQQRITTISLLAMAIRDCQNYKLSESSTDTDSILSPVTNKKRKLELNDPDADASYEQIFDENVEDADGQIKSAYDYYRNQLRQLRHSEIDDILDNILHGLEAVWMKVDKPELAYSIFQSQNDRGKDVEPHILAKSRVHGAAHRLDGKAKDRIIDNWDEIYEKFDQNLGNPRFRSGRNIPIRRPIRHIVSVSDASTTTHIRREKLYDQFDRVVSSFNDIREFVDWFQTQQDTYLKISSSAEDVSAGSCDQQTRRYIQYINCAPSHAEIFSYMLFKKFSDNKDLLREFLEYCAIMSMRTQLGDINAKRDVFYTTASQIEDIQDPGEMRQTLRQKVREKTPSDNLIKQTLIDKDMNIHSGWRYRVRLYLASIEEYRDSSKLVRLDNIDIEHIAPRKTFKKDRYYQWRRKFDKEEFMNHRRKLGNLTLLKENEHKDLDETSFGDKMNTYRNTSQIITKEITKYNNWDAEAIRSRTERMAEDLVERWSIP